MKLRKIFSVALVVVMLLSTVAIGASAIETGKEFGFVVTSDKTAKQIVPGATVTVSIAFEMADFTQLMSDMRLALLYDDTVYTPDLSSRQFINDAANYFKATIVPTSNATFATTTMTNSTMSATDKAQYNNCVLLQCGADVSIGASSKAGFSVTEDGSTGISVPEITVTFTVTGDAAAIAAGSINIGMCDCNSSKAQYIKKTDGTNTPTLLAADAVSVQLGNILANMVAGPEVAYYKAQLKMTATSATTVADAFQFRVQSVITDADWDAYLSNTGDDTATAEAIQSMGIVVYKGAGSFNEATAKALVIDGTAATDYLTAETDYIQKTSDSADAYFGAIMKTTHSATANDVTYMGYIRYLDAAGADQVAFYETTKTAALASNYDTYVTNYLAANPYAG